VLNRTKSGTRVSDATRQRLEAAAAAMGYRPNELARALFRRRTRLIGFYAQFEHLSAENLFLSELIGGMQDATATADCDLVLHTIPPDATPEDAFAGLGDRRVDGLIFFSPDQPALLNSLIQANLPVVTVVDESSFVPSVVVDDHGGMYRLVEHLYDRGHRHFVYRGWHANPVSVINRRRGAEDAAEVLGMTMTIGRVMQSDHRAELLESEWQALENGATAIVCWEDTCAELTCQDLTQRGIDVPGQVAVTGFNGISTVIPLRFRVTTVRAPWRQVGRQAVTCLQELVQGIVPSHKEMLPVEFVQGEST
jgi:DNA-binding LacI/PurR family transcriptional regulator